MRNTYKSKDIFTRAFIPSYLVLVLFAAKCFCEIATSNNQFGLKLYNALADKIEGDLIISPFPLSTIFALLSIGANGTTYDEIKQTLEFSAEDLDLKNDYKRVISDFQNLESLDGLTSEIILSDKIELSEQFEETAFSDFYVIPYAVNFSSSEQTEKEINEWITNSTGHNEKLIKEGDIDSNSSMILLSTSFFKGTWVNQFNPLNTKQSPFFYSHNKSNQVDMMFQRMQIPYAEIEDLDCTSISLPYKINASSDEFGSKESRIELVILLPNSRTGLKDLEKKLKNYKISQIMRHFLEVKDLFVYFPKFKINSSKNFENELRELGLKTVFDPEVANFSKLVSNDSASPAWVSKAYQFTEFSVDEFGSTGLSSIALSSNSFNHNSPESFRVNRPFIGILYDQERHIVFNIFRKIF